MLRNAEAAGSFFWPAMEAPVVTSVSPHATPTFSPDRLEVAKRTPHTGALASHVLPEAQALPGSRWLPLRQQPEVQLRPGPGFGSVLRKASCPAAMGQRKRKDWS